MESQALSDTADAFSWLASLDEDGLPSWPTTLTASEIAETTASAAAIIDGQ